MSKSHSYFHPSLAFTIVVANMIGTGVFTSLGLQAQYVKSPTVILVLWMVGGIIALCGALSYSEISCMFPRSGGEYHFLTKAYHPFLGFLSGWISIVVGLSAPICAISIALSEYIFDTQTIFFPFWVIILMGLVHILGMKASALIQNFLTLFKILVLIFFCLLPLITENNPSSLINLSDFRWNELIAPQTFHAFVFVFYSYSGWNAATYISGQFKNPQKVIPLSLIIGTTFVTILYLILHYIFLSVVPLKGLEGVIDIGNYVFPKLMGTQFKEFISALFGLILFSSLSSLFLIGPRILEVMGQDYQKLSFLESPNRFNSPYIATLLQTLIALILLFTSTFELILQYIGVTLSFSSSLTVLAVIVLRRKKPKLHRPYKVHLYPLPILLFLVINVTMIYYTLSIEPIILLYVVITIVTGLLLYKLLK